MRIQFPKGFRPGQKVIADGEALVVGVGRVVDTDDAIGAYAIRTFGAIEFDGDPADVPPDDATITRSALEEAAARFAQTERGENEAEANRISKRATSIPSKKDLLSRTT